MTRHVIFAPVIIDHVHAQFGQLVHDADHTTLISGDRLGAEQKCVAFLQAQPQIFALRQVRRGRTPFAL